MADTKATIVVVPRDRFSLALRSLENIYENTSPPFELVYVDGGSPAPVARRIAEQARRRGFRLVRTDEYLAPNRARNIGLRHLTTPYVVFVDNDVVVAPGWLDALVRCAEETGASVVGSLYFEGPLEDEIIHMAGGTLELRERDGARLLVTAPRYFRERLSAVPEPITRGPTDYVEYHCLLARADVFERFGPIDEKLLSSREHLDLCMTVRAGGGLVYLEPASVVTFLREPLRLSDLPFFMLRWSETWNAASLDHFRAKWGVETADWLMATLRGRRHELLAPLLRVVRRAPARQAERIERLVLFPLERRLNRLYVRHVR
jgi:GT2 family glycosyltransferase